MSIRTSTGTRFSMGSGLRIVSRCTGRTDDEEDFVLLRPVRLSSQVPIRGRNYNSSLTLGYHGRAMQPDNLPVLRTIQFTQTRAKHTGTPTLAIESPALVHAETATSSVAPSEGRTSVRRPPHSRCNSTSSIESTDLRGHDISPPAPHAVQVGAYSEQEALAIVT